MTLDSQVNLEPEENFTEQTQVVNWCDIVKSFPEKNYSWEWTISKRVYLEFHAQRGSTLSFTKVIVDGKNLTEEVRRRGGDAVPATPMHGKRGGDCRKTNSNLFWKLTGPGIEFLEKRAHISNILIQSWSDYYKYLYFTYGGSEHWEQIYVKR